MEVLVGGLIAIAGVICGYCFCMYSISLIEHNRQTNQHHMNDWLEQLQKEDDEKLGYAQSDNGGENENKK